MRKLALTLLVMLAAVPARASLSVVQAANNTTASGTSVQVTISTTSGNLLVFFTTQGQNNTSTVAISDSASQSWTQTSSGYSGGVTGGRATIWYIANSAAVTFVKATWSGSLTQDVDGIVYEISGAATSSPQDASVNSFNTSLVTSATSGSLTTTNANDILIMGLRIKGAYSGATAGSGYTIPSNGTQQRSATEYNIVSSTQAGVTTTLSWTGSFAYETIFVAFKAAAAAAGPTMIPAVY